MFEKLLNVGLILTFDRKTEKYKSYFILAEFYFKIYLTPTKTI
jgi:hypothetical protein